MTSTFAALCVGLSIPSTDSVFAAPAPRAGDVLPDGTVRFQSGSAELTPASEKILDRLAALLERRPELSPVLVVGHADDRGAEPLNDRLSVGRAEQVRAALIRRGIRPGRIQVEGAGSGEPLTEAKTEAARAKNRRVEVWVTPRGPVARVGRVERRVQSREPAASEWRRAQQNQPLRRLSRVRTLEHSASEIRFPKDDLVTMGPNALAVIYGSPTATRKSRRALSDVDLEVGTLFAALAEREGRAFDIKARGGRYRVRSKKARLHSNTGRKQSTVAVYDGESEVEAAGERVTVPRGYGTRVRDGQPPEPPRRLPPPPAWTRTDPVYRLEGETVELSWKPAPNLAETEVQLGVGNDAAIERPVRLDRVRGATVATSVLPGMYVARLAGIDERGLVGTTGAQRPIVVLPAPRLVATGEIVERDRPDAPMTLAQPGTVRFFAPPQAVLSIQGQSSTSAVDVDLFESRTVVAGLKAADGGPTRYIPLEFEVPAQTVAAEVGEPVPGGDGTALIPIEIRVIDEAGRGVDGLTFQVGQVWAASDRLLTSTAAASLLVPCHCQAPADTSAARALGDGRYRWTLTASVGAPIASTVRFYAAEGSRAVEAKVPPRIARRAVEVAPTPAAATSGLLTTVHAGTWLGTDEDPVLQLGLGLGGRIPVHTRLAVDAWGLVRWFRRGDIGDDLDVFPLTARLALRYTGWQPELYLGGGAGVRVGDVSAKAVGEVFAGLIVPLSVVDLDFEAGYTAAGSEDRIDELAGWGVRLGLRWAPDL